MGGIRTRRFVQADPDQVSEPALRQAAVATANSLNMAVKPKFARCAGEQAGRSTGELKGGANFTGRLGLDERRL